MRLENPLDPVRIGDAVRVGEREQVATGAVDPEVPGVTGELALFEPEQPDRGEFARYEVGRAVPGAVDEDDLERGVAVLRRQRSEAPFDRPLRVIGDDDGRYPDRFVRQGVVVGAVVDVDVVSLSPSASATGTATGSVGRMSGLRSSSGSENSYMSKTFPPVSTASSFAS